MDEKPLFQPGQDSLQASDLNRIVSMLKRAIGGSSSVNVANFGDRIVISAKESPKMSSPNSIKLAALSSGSGSGAATFNILQVFDDGSFSLTGKTAAGYILDKY